MSLPPADAALLEWELALRAIDLLHADPNGLAGMVVRGRYGPVREAFVAALAKRFTIRRVPVNVSEDSLCGGLDVSATLARGTTVMQPGLLDEPDHLLLVCGAERLSPRILGLLASALDTDSSAPRAMHSTQTDDVARRQLPPIVLIDESLADEPGLAGSVLAERLALQFGIPDLSYRHLGSNAHESSASYDDGRSAAVNLATIDASAHLGELTRLADRLGIDSIRAIMLAVRAARVSACLAGEKSVTTRAAALAVQLVLAPRARQLPDLSDTEPPEAEAPPERDDESAAANDDQYPESENADENPSAPAPDSPPDTDESNEVAPPPASPNDSTGEVEALPETLVAAASAVVPQHLLASLARGHRNHASMAGREGEAQAMANSGRPVGVMRPRGRRPERRMNLLETLKAAAPKQRLRGRLAGDGRPPAIRSDDFRLTRYRQPSRTTTVFVVDASGSAAQSRLAEAKGAVELLLAECYVRRDRVALVTFRGKGAVLDLSPTRSLTRAKRCLAGLPGGGGTPLAAGFNVAADLLDQLHKVGESTVAVFMTDGKANIDNTGEASRPQAMADAEQAARRLRALPTRLLFIDTAPRPRAATAALAALMQARYLPLPMANAAGIPALVGGYT